MTDCLCFTCIPTMNVGVIENCGKFDRIAQPGLNVLMCPFESMRSVVSLKINQLDIQCDTKTKDNVFVSVNVAVLFKVNPSRAVDAYYKLTDHRAQMRSFVYDGIRASFPKLELDNTFSSKDEIATHVLEDLRKSMDVYGYDIVNTLITDIIQMLLFKASQRLRVAANYKAEAEKILLVKAAEADSESKYLVGVGVAKQRKAIMDGLKGSVQDFSSSVGGADPKDVMDLLLLTQYFDTMKEIGTNEDNSATPKTLFLPHGPGAVANFRQDLVSGFMLGLKK